MWDRDFIDQVRQANNIVDIIGAYIPLKRSGANYKALSPFKKERTPSFIVNDTKQIWYCFSSNQGGDVFKFVQLYENVDFPTAVRTLAKRANLTLPAFRHSSSTQEAKNYSLKDHLYELHDKVALWWHHYLMKDPSAKVARDYLKQRGITSETAKEFLLGYAPPGWTTTSDWSQKEGFTLEQIEAAGLAIKKSQGAYYDRFRERLMFPITSESGQIIAFSGRVLDPNIKEAKYINSPETPIFTKGKILFGLEKHKRELLEKRQAIVCEGQLDLITCHQAGIRNMVASQGTAFTEIQARVLTRYVDEVILCFDSDEAGQLAILRTAPALLTLGLPLRILQLPSNEDGTKNDPDSFLRKQGANSFDALVQQAPDFWSYYLRTLVLAHDPKTEKGRFVIKREVFSMLSHVTNPTQLDHVLMRLASRLNASLPVLKREFSKKTIPDRGSETLSSQPTIKSHASIAHLLRICLHEPNLIPELQRRLQPEWLTACDGYPLLQKLLEAHETWVDLETFLQTLAEEEKAYFLSLLTQPLEARDPLLALSSSLTKIQKAWLEQEIKLKEQLLKESPSTESNSPVFFQLLDLRKKIDNFPPSF